MNTLDTAVYLRKHNRGQFNKYSYSSIAFLSEHYKYHYYIDSSIVKQDGDGIRFRQYRKTAKSDTISTYYAGDIAIAPTHTEALIRFDVLLHKSALARRMEATTIALGNYVLFQLSDEKKLELMLRLADYLLTITFMARTQKSNFSRRYSDHSKWIGTHTILHTHSPVDYASQLNPLESLLSHINAQIKNMMHNHNRFNFQHTQTHCNDILNMYDRKLKCSICQKKDIPYEREPYSLLELSAQKIHKTLCVRRETAYVSRRWVTLLGLPPQLSRFVYDFRILSSTAGCFLHKEMRDPDCHLPGCLRDIAIAHDHDFSNRLSNRVDSSNVHLFHRDEEMRDLPLEFFKWPECSTECSTLVSNGSNYYTNLLSKTYMRYMREEAQTYSLEVSTGEVILSEDETALRILKTRIISMFYWYNQNYDLRQSLLQSELWCLCPSTQIENPDQMFHKIVVKDNKKMCLVSFV